MNPADANSSLATLRQLKEMLDAGTLTPQEFEALKQKLVFGQEPAAPAAAGTPPAPEPPAETPPAPPSLRVELPTALDVPDSADWMAVAAPVLLENTMLNSAAQATETPEIRRNSLNIIFIVGGILALLAVVLYLTLGNSTPDEHLTSTSQTAADSTATVPEIGPQANQLTLPPAAPETVRVAPAVPVASVSPAAAKFRTDSVASTPASSAPAKAASASPPATPAAADSTAKTGQP